MRDPKPRLIARAPVEDRLVQRAVADLLEPALLRSLRPEAFACRPGFGTERARLALLRAMRSHRYALHLDIRAFFRSIDRDVLRGLLAARVRDRPFLDVVDRILAAGDGLYADPVVRGYLRLGPEWPPAGRGLPVGAHTSQVLASHLYLDALDHHVKRALRVPGYVRYVDDLFLFDESRARLREVRDQLADWLALERGLRLKHPNAPIRCCLGSLDGLGVRVVRTGIGPLPRVRKRLARDLRALACDPGDRGRESAVRSRLAGMLP